MNEFTAYKLYLALRAHFNNVTYDYWKKSGATNASVASYKKRRDQWIFQKLAKHSDPLDYLVSNFVVNPKFWLGDFAEGEKNFQRRRRVLESLTYIFETEIKQFDSSVQDLVSTDREIPKIIEAFLNGKICIETLVIFVDIVGCTAYWNKVLIDEILSDLVGFQIKKYKSFLNYDKDKLRIILKLALPIKPQED